MADTTYGDITPRTAAYANKMLLERAVPYLVFEKYGQAKPLQKNNSKIQKFRKYASLSLATTPLTEGVTPTAKKMTATDVTATLAQYGDLISITDVVMDTHEDPVLQEAVGVLGEQAAQTIEAIRFGILKAGSNVQYANGTARTAVNTPISLALQRKCTRTLKRNNAKRITSVVGTTVKYNSEPIAPAFIGIIHPDDESDIRSMTGFVPAEKYGTMSPWENELGKVEDVRYVTSTVIEPWADGGGDKGTMISTTGTKADVYPVLYVARDAYAIVPLKGKDSIKPFVINPKHVPGDELAQKGHVGWKCMTTCVILCDDNMVRLECAATN